MVKVDELVKKVIEMRFENNQFETATAETVKSINRLDSACKGLNNISAAGLAGFSKAASDLSAVSFSGVASGIHVMVDGFSTMGTIGDTVLRNLTNRVTDFVMGFVGQAKHFASELLGMESIMGGFSEYEDKMGSIQTILTNTENQGTTLEDVTKTLDELNHYADQTIYSFKEMTRNIGTFTAAGVSLEDSAIAIKGISNLAAGVGSTPQQAANAMYQLSQALASGTVNLQDWNSVVNAGMGGQYFQNALKETAREIAEAKGIAVEEFQGTFRESISGQGGTGWLTSEVLLETLKKFADDPSLMKAATRVKTWTQLIDTMKESVGSGWTQTWEYLIGNIDEASEFFTAISQGFDKIVGSAAESRNEMMKFWHDNGGRDTLIKALALGFQNLTAAIKPIKEAFTSAFPPIGPKRLVGMTEQLLNFVSGLKLTAPQLEFVRSASDRIFGALKTLLGLFGGLSKTVRIVAGKQIPEAFSFLLNTASSAESAFGKFIGILEHFLGIDLRIPTAQDFINFGNFINDLLDNAKVKFNEAKIALGEFYASLADGKIKEFTDKQGAKLREFIQNITLEDLKQKLRDTKESVTAFFEQFNIHMPTLSDFWSLIDTVATGIWNLGEKFQNAKVKIGDFFSSIKVPDALKSGRQTLWLNQTLSDETGQAAESIEKNVGKSKTAFEYLVSAIDFVFDVAGHILGRLVELFKPVWTSITDGISEIIQSTDKFTLMDVMKALTAFLNLNMFRAITGAMDSFKGFGDAVSDIGENISGVIGGAKEVFEGLGSTLGAFQNEVNSHALINIAIAVAILTGSVIALSFIDVDAGLDALLSISILVGEMLGAMSILSKIAKESGKLTINIAPIIMISVAAAILSVALIKLSELDIEKIGTGLLGVTALLAELVGVSILMGKYGKKFGQGSFSLILMAFAVSKLASVVISLGDMELDALGKGIAAVGALVLFLTAFSAVAAGAKKSIFAAGIGIMFLASGIKMLSGVAQALGGLSDKELIKGGIALGVVTAGIIAFSYALWAAPVAKLPVVGVGLILIATGMTALATAGFLFSRFSWASLAKAGAAIAGILLTTTLFSIFAKPLKLLTLAIALTALSAALFVLAVDFKLLASLGIEGLLVSFGALIGIFAILGLASTFLAPLIPTILALSGAMILFGVGIAALGAGVVLLAAGLASLGPSILVAIASLYSAVPLFVSSVFTGIAEILDSISILSDSLAKAFVAVGIALIEAIVALAVPLAAGILVLLIVLIDVLNQYMDPLVDKLVEFIDKLLDAILDSLLPELIDWLWKIVVKAADLLLGALEVLFGWIPSWKDALKETRDVMNDYWDKILDERKIKRRNERKIKEIEEGLYDASGNVAIDLKGSGQAQQYVDGFLNTLHGSEKDVADETKRFSERATEYRRDDFASGRSGGFGKEVEESEEEVRDFSDAADDFTNVSSETANQNDELAGSVESLVSAFGGANIDVERLTKSVKSLGIITSATGEEMDGFSGSSFDFSKSFVSLDGVSGAVSELGYNANDFSGFVGSFGETLDDTEDSTSDFTGRMGEILKSVEVTSNETQNFTGRVGEFGNALTGATYKSDDFSSALGEISETLRFTNQDSFASGQMFGEGYSSGIGSFLGKVQGVSYSLGDESTDALRESIDAHSPSRVTAGIGDMFARGFIDSLAENSNSAYWTARQIGEESVSGLTSPFSSLDSMVDDNFSFSPTITPILDMTNVDDGIRYLQNGFSTNPSFGVNSTWTPNIKGYNELSSLTPPTPNIDKIINEMGYLRNDIMWMGEQLSKVQVYLDTGALVGEMSAPLDESLGRSTRQSIRSGRR